MNSSDEARGKFDRWAQYLSLSNYGVTVAVFNRLGQARSDIQVYRQAKNYQPPSYERDVLAVRLVCDTMADEILATAGPNQDADTVNWVAAGLRCRAQPFCTGCDSCQTVTSPQRPAERARSLW